MVGDRVAFGKFAAKHFGLVLGFVRLVRGEERYMDAQLLGFVEHLRGEARGAVVKCPVADLDIRFAGLHLFLQLADLGSILAPLGKRLFHDVIEPLVLGAKLFKLRGLILVIGERRGKLGSERLALVAALRNVLAQRVLLRLHILAELVGAFIDELRLRAKVGGAGFVFRDRHGAILEKGKHAESHRDEREAKQNIVNYL